MIQDTVNDILGKRADVQLTKDIKKIINEEPEVRGVYDLLINDYGPNKHYASVHIELPDILTVDEVDRLTRKIEESVYHKTGVILTGVGVYSYNTKDEEAALLRNNVQKMVLTHDWALQLHGFYVSIAERKMRFDVVLSFDIARDQALETLLKEVQTAYPNYNVQITPDVDLTD